MLLRIRSLRVWQRHHCLCRMLPVAGGPVLGLNSVCQVPTRRFLRASGRQHHYCQRRTLLGPADCEESCTRSTRRLIVRCTSLDFALVNTGSVDWWFHAVRPRAALRFSRLFHYHCAYHRNFGITCRRSLQTSAAESVSLVSAWSS